MHAEILAIGDEITSGQLLDTNTQWLSRRLEEMGIRVLFHSAVGDELAPCAEALRCAIGRADFVICTGGLGPTADDLTREAVAEATGRRLVLDRSALADIRAMFARRKREMPERNERQAMLPEGGRLIENPHGTAPGIDIEVSREPTGPCRVFALPGVAAEMKEMWHGSVVGVLQRIVGRRSVIRHRRIKCFGAGESQIEAMLPDLVRRGRSPRVGITASETTITLRITAEAPDEQACCAAMEPTVATIRECLGDLVFGEDDDELQDAVVRLLRRRKKTLAAAEWGTSGLLAQWLGGVDDAVDHYLGGLVVGSEACLVNLLGAPMGLTAGGSPTGSDVAEAMAAGSRRLFGADYAVAVGRFPDSDPAADQPEPVFIAMAGADGVRVERFPYAGHPAWVKILCAKRAINLVRLALLNSLP